MLKKKLMVALAWITVPILVGLVLWHGLRTRTYEGNEGFDLLLGWTMVVEASAPVQIEASSRDYFFIFAQGGELMDATPKTPYRPSSLESDRFWMKESLKEGAWVFAEGSSRIHVTILGEGSVTIFPTTSTRNFWIGFGAFMGFLLLISITLFLHDSPDKAVPANSN